MLTTVHEKGEQPKFLEFIFEGLKFENVLWLVIWMNYLS